MERELIPAKWVLLAADLLELASGKFSCHGCNDYSYPKDWTEDERREFALAMTAWNWDKEVSELTPEQVEDAEYDVNMINDWQAMSFLASQLGRVDKVHE